MNFLTFRLIRPLTSQQLCFVLDKMVWQILERNQAIHETRELLESVANPSNVPLQLRRANMVTLDVMAAVAVSSELVHDKSKPHVPISILFLQTAEAVQHSVQLLNSERKKNPSA